LELRCSITRRSELLELAERHCEVTAVFGRRGFFKRGRPREACRPHPENERRYLKYANLPCVQVFVSNFYLTIAAPQLPSGKVAHLMCS
jgi:hypothetical protein